MMRAQQIVRSSSAIQKTVRSLLRNADRAVASPSPQRLSSAVSDADPDVGVTMSDIMSQDRQNTKDKYESENIRPLYLDAQATTPMDPRVLDSMLPYLTSEYGNPHSRSHFYGWESETAMENSRQQVAKLIGADAREIVFTSGATESNNVAVKGVAHFYESRKKHVITTQTEHKCVLDSCRYLENEGFRVTYLPVQENGIIDLEKLKEEITPETSLVSIMSVNNEIGVKQPMKEIGEICRENGVFFHTDAAQAVGKIPIDVNEMKIDLMSISGHKIYGPKGYKSKMEKLFLAKLKKTSVNYCYWETRVTPVVLTILGFLSLKKQFGDAIQCWTPPDFTHGWNKYAETVCFLKEGGVQYENIENGTLLSIDYYKWWPFIFVFQSVCFYAPTLVKSRKRVSMIMSKTILLLMFTLMTYFVSLDPPHSVIETMFLKSEYIFPTFVYCRFPIRALGTVRSYVIQCVLTYNVLNHTIFTAVWLWYALLLLHSLFQLVLCVIRAIRK